MWGGLLNNFFLKDEVHHQYIDKRIKALWPFELSKPHFSAACGALTTFLSFSLQTFDERLKNSMYDISMFTFGGSFRKWKKATEQLLFKNVTGNKAGKW